MPTTLVTSVLQVKNAIDGSHDLPTGLPVLGSACADSQRRMSELQSAATPWPHWPWQRSAVVVLIHSSLVRVS